MISEKLLGEKAQPISLLPRKFWNPWFGCQKVSEACLHCYVPSLDEFRLNNEHLETSFKDLPTGTFILVCLQSDFFYEKADKFRESVWNIIKQNNHLIFNLFTKRVDRVAQCLPADWGEGYNNVMLIVTAENQHWADYRIPILLDLPFKHKGLTCSPLLEPLDLNKYLKTGKIELIQCTGESHTYSPRKLEFEWVQQLSNQCKKYNVRFAFTQAGFNFIKDNKLIIDTAPCYFSEIAEAAGVNNIVPLTYQLRDGKFIYTDCLSFRETLTKDQL